MARPTPWRRRRSSGEQHETSTPAPASPPAPAPTPAPTSAASGDVPGPGARAGGTLTAAAPATTSPTPASPPPAPPSDATARRGALTRLRDLTPLLLLRAAHPRQAVLTAALMGLASALADRPTRELGLVLATVLVGQAVLGWHNDLVDRGRDAAHAAKGKPLADGRLEPGTAWFALACGVLLLVPLSVSHGVTAGSAYLVSVALGLVGNVVLRSGVLSFVPWAAAFALYPVFLSYGGWNGEDAGSAPTVVMVVLAALLGVGVHVLRAVWGLVADNEDGWTYLPLRLGLRLGAARLLLLVGLYLALVVVGMVVAGTAVGLRA